MTLSLARAQPLSPPRPPAAPEPRHRVVAVASGRGGVGTTTVAALLAAAMAAEGWRVLLADGVPRLGTLHLLFGLEHGSSARALREGADPAALLVPVGARLSLLPTLHEDAGALSETDRRVLSSRLASTWHAFDLVVVDAGSSAAAILENVGYGVTHMFIVAAADRTGLAATYALIKLLHQRAPGLPIELLTTRLDGASAELVHRRVDEAARLFLSRSVGLAGVIPDDGDFGAALAAGLDAHDAAAGSEAAHAMRAIGERLLADPPPAATPSLRLLRQDGP